MERVCQRMSGQEKVIRFLALMVGYHSDFLIEAPAIIVGRKGSIGEVNLSDEDCWAIDTTYYVKRYGSIPVKYIYYLLKTLKLTELNRATAIPGLNREEAYEQKIWLPPLAEQRRIVAKLDAAMERLRAAEAALAEVPGAGDYEGAVVLLERIRGERAYIEKEMKGRRRKL